MSDAHEPKTRQRAPSKPAPTPRTRRVPVRPIDRNPDDDFEVTKADERRQREAVERTFRYFHFHEVADQDGVGTGEYRSHRAEIGEPRNHTHDEGTPVGGSPTRVGPCLPGAPPHFRAITERVMAELNARPPTPPHELSIWRLKLICGHVIEATAHRSYDRDQWGSITERHCPVCHMDPAIVLAGRNLGPAGPPPKPPAKRAPGKNDILRARLVAAKQEVARLQAEIRKTDNGQS